MESKRLEDKIDKALEILGEVNITLAKQQVSIDEHIRRTNILEKELEPIKKQSLMIKGAIKAIAAVGSIIAAIKIFFSKVG